MPENPKWEAQPRLLLTHKSQARPEQEEGRRSCLVSDRMKNCLNFPIA
ncbi:hypothetical protein [Methanosarcina sp.]|nr:hypothetical protein [Methanosarcina sp.]MDY9926022.1 hypothetical protein [Methanosarcina sp.]